MMISLAKFDNMRCYQARVHNLDENDVDNWKFVPTVTRDEAGRIVTPRQLDGFNCGLGILIENFNWLLLDLYDTE